MKFNPALMSASIFAPPVSLNTGIQDEVLNLAHSDSATSSSSCASSPQKASPVFTNGNANGLTAGHSPTRLSDSSDHLSGGTESPDTTIHPQKVCENCEVHRHRIHELERCLAAKQIELKNTRELMRRISAIAGSLLESCSDFDKQWISHSRKVYSQIQSVICNME
ncbi:unnamed protein product [Anisakis simplex]|uniref:Uncharacterized protein n=1 Tax=Anisakis simplex TaxID=6269 RepID=A0A0M3J8E4_ANISI|nr:unnamed protein product [Anisakis simplex]